jgi:hypothetical protein
MESKTNPSPQRRLAPQARESRDAAGQDEVGAANAPEGAISAGMPRRTAKQQKSKASILAARMKVAIRLKLRG